MAKLVCFPHACQVAIEHLVQLANYTYLVDLIYIAIATVYRCTEDIAWVANYTHHHDLALIVNQKQTLYYIVSFA